jgi:hypothetical protein
MGQISEENLIVEEDKAGSLTGKWGAGKMMTIEKGKRLTATTFEWESLDASGGTYRVRCVQKGKSLVFDWTYTAVGASEGPTWVGTSVLVRKK